MANTRRYAHFIAAMEQRSFIGAAQMVNLSQPALSKSILALEDEYGVKLFDRHPRGLVPTQFGHALEYHARRILLDVKQSKSDLAAMASGAVGRIRIGVGQGFVGHVETALLELEQDFPSIDNLVITDYAEGLRLALLENRIEIYLGMANRLVDDEEFETTIVASDPILGLCHHSHAFAEKEVSFEQLRDQEWAVPERGELARSALEAHFLLNLEQKPRFKVVTNVPVLLGRYVREAQLLSLLPASSLGEYKDFGLTWFKIKGFQSERKIGIVRRRGVAANPLSARFREIMISVMNRAFENHPLLDVNS
ncbi:LysR family transcriptional regulator [Pelagimonas varians]|uniref:HTH-type transcriptional regulator GbpR n=1 Tax=Pelagimonas varians TaxID=696760 RepID=A0A238KSU7_9RHOB|nr:LysR family transcriptional regulator [Pelagimonas varians]PYG32521.1 LysR family transcriptional regulator [Pelagimonas varians]SMX45788.1 HTH-type transcriptional regulator GbpR [Pelagimonas varians]